jgi:hypothetical protein
VAKNIEKYISKATVAPVTPPVKPPIPDIAKQVSDLFNHRIK